MESRIWKSSTTTLLACSSKSMKPTTTTPTTIITIKQLRRRPLTIASSSSLSSLSSSHKPNQYPNFTLFNSSSSSPFSKNHISPLFNFTPKSHPNHIIFQWNNQSLSYPNNNIIHTPLLSPKQPLIIVVLLGWLGSQNKHLKRYVEWYNSRQVDALTFVVQVNELWVDFGGRVEKRIHTLVDDLIVWASTKQDDDGRERNIVFHTFSNTGWLAYGAILESLQGRQDILDKIKGCVFDSGAGDPLNPKVWAAGFGAALLKKRSSSTYPTPEATETKQVKIVEEPPMIESMLLSVLEKFFYVTLKVPDVKKRLEKIIFVLTNCQPCPQLYLYSTADKVVPSQSINVFIESQKSLGKKVTSFNFGTSPHVDHYRTFPTTYSSQLHSFWRDCFSTVKLP
ncbi:hypothetical protein ACFE04_013784 [Oxalis oulophora]